MPVVPEKVCLPEKIKISAINTGFIEIPDTISMNLYVQGCKLRCKNCQNVELQPFEGGHYVDSNEFHALLSENILCEWVVWLGGDAVYQPDALKAFNKIAKSMNYNVCLYTGLYKDDLDASLIQDVDLLIDGPYDENHGGVKDDATNQKVYVKKDGNWQNILYTDISNYLRKV